MLKRFKGDSSTSTFKNLLLLSLWRVLLEILKRCDSVLWSIRLHSGGFFPEITATEKLGKEAGVQSLRASTGHMCGRPGHWAVLPGFGAKGDLLGKQAGEG